MTTIGSYQIERELGRGGMGVVYLANDTRLDRQVAIKALPEHLANDPDRLGRFEREAKTPATLNHPNVAGIYGVEGQDGWKYLVLEYVEGETLAERLDRGRLPNPALERTGRRPAHHGLALRARPAAEPQAVRRLASAPSIQQEAGGFL